MYVCVYGQFYCRAYFLVFFFIFLLIPFIWLLWLMALFSSLATNMQLIIARSVCTHTLYIFISAKCIMVLLAALNCILRAQCYLYYMWKAVGLHIHMYVCMFVKWYLFVYAVWKLSSPIFLALAALVGSWGHIVWPFAEFLICVHTRRQISC